ncbi:MAG: SpoIIE family protein phosphatase [Candidatus Eremiobacteraeota bacterium]|nr:SpoIIE family protein phosphatase [Candidatus Eremiobacteraeota bacterium]
MKRRPRWAGSLLRSAGTLSATAILVVALIFAVSGAFSTRAQIAASFDEQQALQSGEVAVQELQRIQLDEQNYIQEYVITRDPTYLSALRATTAEFGAHQATLRSLIQQEHLMRALGVLDSYVAAHRDWYSQVAQPLLLRAQSDPAEIYKRGKAFADLERDAAGAIEAMLHNRSVAVSKNTQEQVNRTLYQRAFWLIVFGLLAVLFNAYRSRLDRELEEERTTTHTLQRAFQSEHVPLANCDIGTAYGSASSHLAVGGDVYDVYQLSDRLALLLIADVSGKGVDAAVLTAFIKFTIRGIALRRRDPGYILQEFNTAFPRTVANPYLFVSMFVGILDTRAMRLQYASAGHDPIFVRRSNGVQQLSVTGPVLGVMEEPFDVRTLYLEDGDTIVLATDGLTEARDAAGTLLEAEGAMQLIERSGDDPQALADNLIAQVRARGGNAMHDDLAILAIRVHASHDDRDVANG